jgi:hypothetical protein
MLIRLCGHFIDNPRHVDKLICIKGLPESYFFRPSRFGGKELISPWTPDNESNIPQSIRYLCEEIEITKAFPPIEKGKDSVVDKYKILGVKLEYTSGPGQEMWEQIEGYLERMIPRDQRVPKPVLCAPDQKSEFNPTSARRTVRGSLELQSGVAIPVIVLSDPTPVVSPIVQSINLQSPIIQEKKQEIKSEVKQEIKPETFLCKKCNVNFPDQKSRHSHYTRGHKDKELIGV